MERRRIGSGRLALSMDEPNNIAPNTDEANIAPRRRRTRNHTHASRNRAPDNRRNPGEHHRHNNEVKPPFKNERKSDLETPQIRGNRDQGRKFHVGFKILEGWTTKDANEIILELMGRKTGFEELIDSDELSGDTIILVIKVLAKLCGSAFSLNKTFIMNLASRDKFIESLQKYIFHIQLQDNGDRRFNKYFWRDVDDFFNNLRIICASLIETVPTRACEVLPKTLKAIIIIITYLNNTLDAKVTDTIKTNLEKLQEKLILCQAEIERKKKVVLHELVDETPPDNFRELSIYPTSEEVLSGKQAFIRRNVIDGAYQDVDHYLDVQFRLLKEDFVAPLREGVSEFLKCEMKENRRMKFSNVRIHQHVEFVSPYFNKDKAGVLVQFEFAKKKMQVNYRYSRRFMFGSLLCFTKDNFTTIIFGKVTERDIELLQKRQIVVEFQPGQDNFELNKRYLMVECNIYFEPYYHVLTALQNIYEDTFPMKKYLIDVDPGIEAPKYLNDESVFDINDFMVTVLAAEAWPTADQLNLDPTQYVAFKSALTQNFSVIQGPPGTGKTYLGLQIAKTLIINHASYNKDPCTPILVVCFTNHALDQFLEGLIDTTKRIIRVGGQSKNKKLESFNLRTQRGSISDRPGSRALYNVRNELYQFLNKINCWKKTLDIIDKYDCIFDFRMFSAVDRNFQSSWFASASSDAIRKWLLGGRTVHARKMEKIQTELQKLMNADGSKEVDLEASFDAILEADHRDAVEDLSDFEYSFEFTTPTFLLTLENILHDLQHIISKLKTFVNDSNDIAVFNSKWDLERKFEDLEDDYNYLKMRLNEGRLSRELNIRDGQNLTDVNLKNPHHMAPENRWKLYFHWLELYRTLLIQKLVDMQTTYRETYKQYTELKDIDDIQVMKQMVVVGMTTTGAARLQSSLQALRCRIVIVEEAAEVLESHIVVSLTQFCEHLILIGDHKQLRPSTATFKLEKDFALGISLFERMVLNKIQCHVLGVQHRMRPEFANLIVPAIYPNLQNHESVEQFPPVFGVSSNLYFITHNKPEKEAGDSSKENEHEASFLIALARYLIQNGYQPEDITIIAAYSGQMFALWQLRNAHPLLLKDVRITVLDNYQGEESKIILLSLVRNNQENSIGFLKIENRVCVALSRAKEGFYIMGNIDLLCRNSTIWPKIKQTLVDQQALGNSLPLQCQLHPQNITLAESANDFKRVPEGGCYMVCGEKLRCGHNCASICHIKDRVHATTMCKSDCIKILCEYNHKCQKLCYEDCGSCPVLMRRVLPCGHEHDIQCSVNVDEYQCCTLISAKLPCNHEVLDKPCHIDVLAYRCPFPCETRVEPCGHSCSRTCHIQSDSDHIKYRCFKPCGKTLVGCSTGEHMCPKTCYENCPPCDIVIMKQRTMCRHKFDVSCNANVDEIECTKPCKKELPCGHKCKKKCCEDCGDCLAKVKKVLPSCNHEVPAICSKPPESKMCKAQCIKELACGHPCTKLCNEICTTQCQVLVDHNKPVDCGHTFKIPCYMLHIDISSYQLDLLQYCKQPCTAELMCKHKCVGTCGKCMQGRIHTTCREKCGVHLVCGHECSIPCRETCQPCTEKCNFACRHSVCRKTCGDPCTKCVEPCFRRCIHASCTAKCGELCTVPPCNEPCLRKLKCGHNCVGFCGDPCPKLCRICDHDELTEIFFGDEDEENARFVLLECKHVVESTGMEQWLNQTCDQIGYKQCPKCKTTLSKTARYSNYIKIAMQDVLNIKKRYFGVSGLNEAKRTELLATLQSLKDRTIPLSIHHIDAVINKLAIALNPIKKGRRQPMNLLLIDTFTAKIQILTKIVEIYTEAKLDNSSHIIHVVSLIKLLVRQLLPSEQRFTQQEIADCEREINRLVRLAQLFHIKEKFSSTITDMPELQQLYNEIKDLLFARRIFCDRLDTQSKENIFELNKKLSNAPLTDTERTKIVLAMGMQPGHWFKCPNGHYYAVGECGRPMQVGKCIECGVAIGGSDHRLLSTNQHAGEIDNSRHPVDPLGHF